MYAGNRGLQEMAGAAIVLRERFQTDFLQEHRLDSSAAVGFFHRRGSGSMKHVETKDMWGQTYVRAKSVTVVKIPREDNCADALASLCSARDLTRHLATMNVTMAVTDGGNDDG